MQLLAILLAVAAATGVIYFAIRNQPWPATSADWFVVFRADAEAKTLSVSFFPVVAIYQSGGDTVPITSRPLFSKQWASSKPAEKVNDGPWGFSLSFGRWMRDGVFIDQWGNPEMSERVGLLETIAFYARGGFHVQFETAVPFAYAERIAGAARNAGAV